MKLALIGFMGAGKSTVAKLLAAKLKLPFIELDDLIVKEAGRASVNEVFKIDGERRFRQLEAEAVARVAKDPKDCVISTGGGVIQNQKNTTLMKQAGIRTVFLSARFEEIENRIGTSNDRPLFADRDAAYKLYLERQPLYMQSADLVVKTDGLNLDSVVRTIAAQISTFK